MATRPSDATGFFATLECELLDRRRFETQAAARLAVFEFVEGWYNPHRRHSSLGYLSPLEFERRRQVVAAAMPAAGPPEGWRCSLTLPAPAPPTPAGVTEVTISNL